MKHDHDPEAMIQATRRHVQKTRNLYYDRAIDGDISRDLHLELAKRVLEYNDVLLEYKNADGVDPTDFPDVDVVKQRMGQTKPSEVEAPGDTRNTTVEQRPAVLSIDPADLIQMTNRLDEVASDLGFGADPDSSQPGGIA
jgi:hypothetical protein